MVVIFAVVIVIAFILTNLIQTIQMAGGRGGAIATKGKTYFILFYYFIQLN